MERNTNYSKAVSWYMTALGNEKLSEETWKRVADVNAALLALDDGYCGQCALDGNTGLCDRKDCRNAKNENGLTTLQEQIIYDKGCLDGFDRARKVALEALNK